MNTKLPITGDTVIEQEMIQLASGQQVPSVGLGLWKIEQDATAQVVQQAIDCGYRHFDSACDYGNEVQTGEGLAASLSKGIVKREDLWVTSKLWNTYHRKEHVRPAQSGPEKTVFVCSLHGIDKIRKISFKIMIQ